LCIRIINDFLHADGYFPEISIKLYNFTIDLQVATELYLIISLVIRSGSALFGVLSILMHCFISEIGNGLSVMEFSVSNFLLNYMIFNFIL